MSSPCVARHTLIISDIATQRTGDRQFRCMNRLFPRPIPLREADAEHNRSVRRARHDPHPLPLHSHTLTTSPTFNTQLPPAE